MLAEIISTAKTKIIFLNTVLAPSTFFSSLLRANKLSGRMTSIIFHDQPLNIFSVDTLGYRFYETQNHDYLIGGGSGVPEGGVAAPTPAGSICTLGSGGMIGGSWGAVPGTNAASEITDVSATAFCKIRVLLPSSATARGS
jgi:hypothetical protein